MTKEVSVDMQALIDRLGGVVGVGGVDLMPMPEDEIAAFEEGLGVRLPEEYRRFLATYGASNFPGASEDNPYVVSRMPDGDTNLLWAFYGAQRDEGDGFSVRNRHRWCAVRMPASIIPIGDDGWRSQICLGIKGNEVGKVYYWDGENEPLDEEDYLEEYGVPRPPEAMFENVVQVAESFDHFLGLLELRAEE